MSRDEATTALQECLGGLDDAALKRVRDAAPRKWTTVVYVDHRGCRCLLGHAEDWRYGREDPDGTRAGLCPGEDAFYELVARDGLTVTVASIRLKASLLLRERELQALELLAPSEEFHAHV